MTTFNKSVLFIFVRQAPSYLFYSTAQLKFLNEAATDGVVS